MGLARSREGDIKNTPCLDEARWIAVHETRVRWQCGVETIPRREEVGTQTVPAEGWSDSSASVVMLRITTANTMAPCVVIGERAARRGPPEHRGDTGGREPQCLPIKPGNTSDDPTSRGSLRRTGYDVTMMRMRIQGAERSYDVCDFVC
jgi:hypothetical protein